MSKPALAKAGEACSITQYNAIQNIAGENRKEMLNATKLFLASLLVVMLLALGGLSAVGSSGIASFFSNSNAALDAAQASPAVALSGTQPTAGESSTQNAPGAQSGVADARTAVRVAGTAVVTVINTLTSQSGGNFGRRFGGASPQASGSGVIIDNRGYIVTNNHVVEQQQSLQVVFADGSRTSATLVGTDPYSDLAVIKVDRSVPAVAQFGDSDALEVGQPVVAIGSALGDYENTVTEGIVSGLHRTLQDANAPSLQDLIQTDAAINHGNSGGPLLDLSGKVVGINTAVVRGDTSTGDVAEGLGFAIPAKTAQQVANQLMAQGSVERPFIGISYQPIDAQVAAYYNLSRTTGLLITDVQSGSPAEKAGITANSIMTSFDGTELTGTTSLVELLMKHKIGDTVKAMIVPPDSQTEKEVTITLAERPAGQ
jgi:2-alkenal reductase